MHCSARPSKQDCHSFKGELQVGARAAQAVERSQGAALLSTTVARCSRQRFVSSLLPWGAAAAGALRSTQGGSERAVLWSPLAVIFERCGCSAAVVCAWHVHCRSCIKS
jgi:hypothetical protein